MAITHDFKDSRDSHGNGYSGYIEDGKLVLEYWDPRSGGVYFKGSYEEARKELHEIKYNDPVLYNDIEKYFSNGVVAMQEPKPVETTVFKVRVHVGQVDYGNSLICRVSGSSREEVTKELLPAVPKVLILTSYFAGTVTAVRSDKIVVIEFMED